MEKIHEIPAPEVYKKTNFKDSKFVELKDNTFYTIEMQYPLLGMKNAEMKCIVREEVGEMLIQAAKLLPLGYKFKILDAWRPFSLQFELYSKYSEMIIKEFQLELCSEEQKKAEIAKFVSEPLYNPILPPVHTTGGAVDLTIIDNNGLELNMGTEFDAFTEKTYTVYFEDKNDDVIKENRRLLYNVMSKAGFTNLPSEWWHYDYGDRFWAFYTKNPSIYKGVFTKEEIYEQVR